jgi:hypothetical protein
MGIIPKASYDARITLVPKPDEDITQKKSKSISLKNIVKNPHKRRIN